jgi:glucosamine--fructose-6-phosphate aminotransferase (isomerizing)
LKSNVNEVASRGGELIIFTDSRVTVSGNNDKIITIKMPMVMPELTPLLYVIPLQLLAYYVADLRGNNVDQPRNLAKSVTVE